MADELVHYEQKGPVALIRFDDGKANAFSHAVLDALEAALDRAAAEAKAVVIVGRPGRFSAGLDLATMRQGGDAVGKLVGAGARLAIRLYEYELPVVLACSGHALAMGAILLLAGDVRIGSEGDFKIGMNEVAIGLPLPRFAIDFGRERLSKRHFTRATTLAEVYSPSEAVDAGYLDRVTSGEALVTEALAEAERLSALDSTAHRVTKQRARADLLAKMRAELDEDMKKMTAVKT